MSDARWRAEDTKQKGRFPDTRVEFLDKYVSYVCKIHTIHREDGEWKEGGKTLTTLLLFVVRCSKHPLDSNYY